MSNPSRGIARPPRGRLTPEGFESLQDRLTELVSAPLPEHPAFTAAVGLLTQLPAKAAGAAPRPRTVPQERRIAGLETERTELKRHLHRLLLELEYPLELRRGEPAWVRRPTAGITAVFGSIATGGRSPSGGEPDPDPSVLPAFTLHLGHGDTRGPTTGRRSPIPRVWRLPRPGDACGRDGPIPLTGRRHGARPSPPLPLLFFPFPLVRSITLHAS
ncbi:hypothetical protein GCM10017673_12740 [Streptosporangium violaceochromogenes]|nr:hypothetical protein GCM10017673_12740 [Streptosporangium violaceochromogenes]